MATAPSMKPMRAAARRNRELILGAARELFASAQPDGTGVAIWSS